MKQFVSFCSIAGLLAALSCGGGDSTPPNATVATVTVAVPNSSLIVAQTTQATATTKDASGNTLTGRALSWTSSATGVASVSSSGLVTASSPGSATITATSEGVSGTTSVTVAAAVASVVVTPLTAAIAIGATQQLTGTARDASNAALTGRTITWSSGNTSIATVSNAGLVTGVSAGGPVTITATSEGQSGTASVTITPPPVATVAVSLGSASIAAGLTTGATATVRDAAGTALTGRTVTWSSSDQAVATFDVAGTVTALGPGTATITATSEGRSGTATLTVTAGTASGAPVSTAAGTSTGNAVTQSIGAGGGTLTSGDGRLTLIVPANAVAANTTFSIEPYTNPAPGGLGASYQLLPENVAFVQPVQLAFKVSDDDLAGTSP